MDETITVYIGLGSNLGDRKHNIETSLEKLNSFDGIDLLRVSGFLETAPLGGLDQPKYLNAVAEIKTSLTVQRLFERIIETEDSLKRMRGKKWTSRTIDLDILLFGDTVLNTAGLTIPHPQMHLRSFVLSCLCELNPSLVHPVLGESVGVLAKRLGGQDYYLDANVPQLVSIAGVIGVGKTTLAERLSGLFGCEIILEPYDTNPYMPEVYAGRKELALDSQLYFLNHRLEQLNRNNLKSGRLCISDYVFDKDPIYAELMLDEKQLAEYRKSYFRDVQKILKPVLAIYLTDTVENCLRRIHRRNRPYEQRIEAEFLEKLSAKYDKLFQGWKTCPVIRILVCDFDFNKSVVIEHIAKQIKAYTLIK
jgi:2-amino-4-hydroxy-6-hydroxymethyldihydropteridine diphosphokinase